MKFIQLLSTVRLGSTFSIFKNMQAGRNISVLDFVHAGSTLSMRSFTSLGSNFSVFSYTRMGSTCSVLDFVNLGSTMSMRSYMRAEYSPPTSHTSLPQGLSLYLCVKSVSWTSRAGRCHAPAAPR